MKMKSAIERNPGSPSESRTPAEGRGRFAPVITIKSCLAFGYSRFESYSSSQSAPAVPMQAKLTPTDLSRSSRCIVTRLTLYSAFHLR